MAAKAGMKFAFGKHKGKTFEEVAKADPSYCTWARKTENPSGALKDFIEFLEAQGPATPGLCGDAARPAYPSIPGSSDAARNASLGRLSGRPAATPQAGERFGAGISRLPTDFQYHGPKLDEDITLVVELCDADSFLVRAEKNAGMSMKYGAGKAKHGEAPVKAPYLLPQVWHAITGMPGCRTVAEKGFLFPRNRLEAVSNSLERIGKVERVPDWVSQLFRRSPTKPDCVMEERLPEKLLPYQREGVEFGLGKNGRCLIGDEMGLGKTLQALSLAAQYAEEWPVLVLCPSSLRWVWKEQVEEWLPDFAEGDDIQVIKKGSEPLRPDARFWIVSYSMLASSVKSQKNNFQTRPDGTPHTIVIADESHNIKEWGAERTKAAVPVINKAKRAILLSGTPTRNSPDELHPQLCSLIPGFRAKLVDFRSRYCMQQQSQVFGGRVVTQVVGARNSTELNYLLTDTVMVRRLKKDVLKELPPKRRQKVPLEVGDTKQMKEIKNNMSRVPDSVLVGSDGNEAVSSLFQNTAKIKLPAVKEYLLEVLDRGDEKTIIFAHHQLMMDEISALLEKRLAKDDLFHIRIDGKTSGPKRPELVKKFQTDPQCRVALLSITACSEGLTLSAAGLVIFAELYWVPGAIEQAEARAHRIGNVNNAVIVEFLVVPNSPDERIYNSLERKKKDTSKVIDGMEESLGALERLTRKRAAQIQEDRCQSSLNFFGQIDTNKKPRVAPTVINEPNGLILPGGASKSAAASSDAAGAAAGTDAAGPSGGTVGQSPAPKTTLLERMAIDSSKPTPSPVAKVPNWKVEYLLRAAKG